jgi:hypothetical protein
MGLKKNSREEYMKVVFQNKVEKRCILLASIIRMYHKARSSECQMSKCQLRDDIQEFNNAEQFWKHL